MKILSNKKYNDLISKQFRGIFADVNDDNLLRENGLLYGENKELQKEIDRLNNIINKAIEYIKLIATDYDIMNNNEIIYTQMQYEEIENLLEILDKAGNSNKRNKDNK